MPRNKITIDGVDPQVWREFRAASLLAGVSLGIAVTRALKSYMVAAPPTTTPANNGHVSETAYREKVT